MLSKNDIIKCLNSHRQQIRRLGVTRLTLFGSFARDEQTEHSDVDLLVEYEAGRGLFRDMADLYNLLELIDEEALEVRNVNPHLLGVVDTS
ncbi:nucleotidyltransferase domain-containing protein [Planctomycetota bacterium]|nr:nucleotidyltransferase domain-containing protein [Planctomycetota bacterium]